MSAMKKSLQCLLLLSCTIFFSGCGGDGANGGAYIYLSDLTVSSRTLTPLFNQSTISYTVEVDYDVSSITVTPTIAGVGEAVTVQGQAVTSGTASQPINLDVGQNTITIMVTAQYPATTKTYIIVVTRLKALSNNANLSGLSLSTGALSPALDENTISYTAEVAHGTSSITVIPTVAGIGATIKVNDVTVTSGTASQSIYLDGDTNISVVVTAQDTTTTKTYTIETKFIFCSNQDNGLVKFTYNGQEVTYGTVVSAESRCWLDRNLGACPNTDPKEYSGYNDEKGYGDLFQWGRGDDSHQNRDSNITTTLSETDVPGHGEFISAPDYPYNWRNPKNDNLWQGVNGINNPCPPGWRIPTEAEWNTEISSWSQKGFTGAFNSPLKLTAAGYRGISDGLQISPGSFWVVGSFGLYWSDGRDNDGRSARYLNYGSSGAVLSRIYRECALSVRCIKD